MGAKRKSRLVVRTEEAGEFKSAAILLNPRFKKWIIDRRNALRSLRASFSEDSVLATGCYWGCKFFEDLPPWMSEEDQKEFEEVGYVVDSVDLVVGGEPGLVQEVMILIGTHAFEFEMRVGSQGVLYRTRAVPYSAVWRTNQKKE